MLAALSFGALCLNLGRFLLQTCCQPSGMNNTDVTTEEPKGRISLDMGQEEKKQTEYTQHMARCAPCLIIPMPFPMLGMPQPSWKRISPSPLLTTTKLGRVEAVFTLQISQNHPPWKMSTLI